MVKKLLLCMMLVCISVSQAVSAETHLYAEHYSLADIKDGKSDLSSARFHRVELRCDVSLSSNYYFPQATMTLSGGRYSYWNWGTKAMQTVTGETKTFPMPELRPLVSVESDDYKPVYFLSEADGGLNGVNVTCTFPDDPSLNVTGTVPNFRTTQQQLDSFVPYIEYVYSGDKVSGFMVRLVNQSNVSVPVVLDTNVRVSLGRELAEDSGYIHLGTHGFYGYEMDFNAGETPEATVMFGNEFDDVTEVNASDILAVRVSMIVGDDSEERYEWTYYNTDYSNLTRLWTNHMTEAHLVNGKSDYSRARFRELYIDAEKIFSVPEAKHLTTEGRMTIPGGGYTIKQTDEVIPDGQDMTFRLKENNVEFDGYFMDYQPVDSEGRMIAFNGGAEQSLNGRTITWTFPDELNINGSGVVPDFKSVSEQIERCVPYVEFVNSGDHIGSLRYRLVANGETGTAIHPNYRTDATIYVQIKDGRGFSTENAFYNTSSGEYEVSRWSGTRWEGTNRYTLDDVDYVRVRLYSFENLERPCVYQWFFRTTSSSELPSGTIQPVQTLAPDVLQNIVNNVDGISSVSEINYLTGENIDSPADPTDEMTQTVQEDQHEIIGILSTLKADTSGWYVMKITLSDELFEAVKGMNAGNLKVYSLADSESQTRAALINGILNTWELLSLSGEKIDTIGAKELLMVGLLEAGQSFSMFLAKLIIALLAGGCTTGFTLYGIAAILLLLLRKH